MIFSIKCDNVVTVHPHACGEHYFAITSGNNPGGSSPRLWGTYRTSRTPRLPVRFIPTPVGNMSASISRRIFRQVHPHACGEHPALGNRRRCGLGSSPRLWGTWDRARRGGACSRFIPTPVGNIAVRYQMPRREPVHPHACGEHSGWEKFDPRGRGSSPRLWGTLADAKPLISQCRFIPTPVGNMRRQRAKSRLKKVHPHACGEHRPRRGQCARRDGSSPRLWGT